MSILILKPTACECGYAHAAEAFQDMYAKVTGQEIPIVLHDDGQSDLFVIGADSVNDFVMEEIENRSIRSLGIRYGTDDYTLLSYLKGRRRIVVLAGGRVRSTIYAVYDFFERFADCRYFWDGDVIPEKEIELGDFAICESPRFEYRGLRYFAHRGLKRFQAEHWSLAEWQAELDWLLKKRLNLFMLRIGMDDVWQRAFPEEVPYPDGFQTITDQSGYNDRTDFWTLKYRGELRERVLEYARKLDLIYPTDCGTMTHWYSRTPNAFLERKRPTFLPQSNDSYVNDDTGRVWDFRDPVQMQRYMRLTETMVEEYEKRTDYFHTIGLGERRIFADPEKNHTLKLIAYRRIAEQIRTRYPSAKLFVASWDFVGWWTGEEVQALVRELDPASTVILDYTSEVNDPEQSFLNWGVVGKFPWIFGLFHAYESESELRGPYRRTEERLRVAAADPFCKGMILWPELSHSDPLVLEYLAEHAWSPLQRPIEQTVTDFCRKRYGADWEMMDRCWQKFLPFLMQGDWGGYSTRGENEPHATEYYNNWHSHNDIWVKPYEVLDLRGDGRYQKQTALKIGLSKGELAHVAEVCESLAEGGALWENAFFKRDAIDIIRTALGRFLNLLLASALYDSEREGVEKKRKAYFALLECLRALLSQSRDFSVYQTLEEIGQTAPTNPAFEKTLKENIGNSYCRQFAYELMEILFEKEAKLVFDWIADGKKEEQLAPVRQKQAEIFARYLDTPLADLRPEAAFDPAPIAHRAAACLRALYKVL